MRKWHRWIMTVFIVMLSYWTISGLIMALYDATDAHQVWAIEGGGPSARLTDAALTAAAIPDPAQLAGGIGTALTAASALPIASVDLRMRGDIPRLEFAEASGKRDTMLRFNAATGASVTQAVADGETGQPPPAYVTQRNTLKAWHRGNIIGMFGQFVGLFTGLALIAMVVTGVIMYFQIWGARSKAGKGSFFWNSKDSLWRRLHRWVSIVAAALILNIAVSGTILAYGEIQLNFFLFYHIGINPYPRPTPLPPVSAGTLPRDVNGMLQRSYASALNAQPGARVTSIELVQREGVPKAIVVLGGARPRTLAFNAVSGAPVSDWETTGTQVGTGYFADWHQALKRIHRGDIIGNFGGRYIDMAAGLALLYLVVSAFVLYFDMFRKRRTLGRAGWFWK